MAAEMELGSVGCGDKCHALLASTPWIAHDSHDSQTDSRETWLLPDKAICSGTTNRMIYSKISPRRYSAQTPTTFVQSCIGFCWRRGQRKRCRGNAIA